MSLLEKRSYYKPFARPWAFEAYNRQQQIHWLPDEVPLGSDISNWNHSLSEPEKNLLTQLFRFFTQADVDIAGGYIDKFLPVFQEVEVRMMLTAFANMESIHIHAYSRLLDDIGMPEVEYSRFQEYEDMKAKHSYLEDIVPDSLENIAKTLAIYSAFGEGLQLFSSFAILLNFSRFNKMKGMCQIVTYSVRDESHHVDSMIRLFHDFIDENPKIWKSSLKKEIYLACQDMVILEDKFIDLAFKDGGVQGLTPEEVKNYIRFIADRRCLQLGLKPIYKVKKNPLGWLDAILNAVEYANFFETLPTEYSTGMLTGSWDEVKW